MRTVRGVALVVGLVACAHADDLQGRVLRAGDVTVELGPVPGSWRRVRVDGGNLAYRDDDRSAVALLDVRCGRGDDAPLTSLTGHLIMGTTERQYEKQDVVPFDGREALHTLLAAKLDGVAMHYDIYVTKKDGCVEDLVYVAPPDRFASGASDFERFALGMHAQPSGTPPPARDP
jgi:hypothetical protein